MRYNSINQNTCQSSQASQSSWSL